MPASDIRCLAIAVLDDPQGINEDAWNILREMLGKENNDIIQAVNSCENRFFLPEDHGLIP